MVTQTSDTTLIKIAKLIYWLQAWKKTSGTEDNINHEMRWFIYQAALSILTFIIFQNGRGRDCWSGSRSGSEKTSTKSHTGKNWRSRKANGHKTENYYDCSKQNQPVKLCKWGLAGRGGIMTLKFCDRYIIFVFQEYNELNMTEDPEPQQDISTLVRKLSILFVIKPFGAEYFSLYWVWCIVT